MDKGHDMATDKIVSRPASDKYREEYDRIFGQKKGNNHEGKLPRDTSNGPQYGVVQYVGDSGPQILSESVENDFSKPVSEDGSEPSSK